MPSRGETVTIITRTKSSQPDAKGNDVYTETPTDVSGAVVWPTGSTETLQRQDQVTTGLTVLLPASTPVAVTAISAMLVRGLKYEVEGNPSDWRSPFTSRRPGYEVRLTRVTG